MLCPYCKSENEEGTEFCKNCGKNLNQSTFMHTYKDPGLAGFFSAIFPGLGQAYNEQLIKGVLLFAIATLPAISILIIIIQYSTLSPTLYTEVFISLLLILAFYLIIWLIGVYDAQKSAKKINKK